MLGDGRPGKRAAVGTAAAGILERAAATRSCTCRRRTVAAASAYGLAPASGPASSLMCVIFVGRRITRGGPKQPPGNAFQQ